MRGRLLLRQLGAFVRRDWQTQTSYRTAFLLSFVGIFFRAFIFFFIAAFVGTAVNDSLGQYGGDYFAFVLVGLAFNLYLGIGLNGFADSLREAQTTGTLEAMLMTPAPVSLLILGSAVWSYAFTTGRVLVYFGLGFLLGVDFSQANLGAAVVVLLLAIISLGSIGIVAASVIMVIKRGDPLTMLIGNVSALVGGVYYPVESLPDWLQLVAYLLPITYALRAMRLALLSGAGWAVLAPDLLALALFALILLPISLLTFRWAVDRARAEGTLTHY